MGGFDEALVRFALSLAGKERPRVVNLPTAVATPLEMRILS